MTENDSMSSDQLALQRTLMASERTFMAWTRTALSLISFGFAIPKILEQADPGRFRLGGDSGPRLIGIVLLGLGVMILASSSYQHGALVRKIRMKNSVHFATSRLSYVVAIVLFVIGVLALLNLTFHVGPF